MFGSTALSGSDSSDKEVTVPVGDVKAVYEFACSDVFVAGALNKIEDAVMQGGLSVKMKEFKREVKLSEDHQSVVHKDWADATVKLMRSLFTFGFAVVRPVPHPKYPGEFIPHVIPWDKFTLSFVVSSRRPRKYLVQYNDVAYPAITLEELVRMDDPGGGDGPKQPAKKSKGVPAASEALSPGILQFQANENNLGYPLMDGGRGHLIFVFKEPTTEGYLQSPVALIKSDLTMLREMYHDESYAGYWRARPLHVVRVTKNFFGGGGGGTTGRETFGVGLFGEGDIHMDHEKYRFERNEEEQRDFRLAQRAAEEGRMVTLADKESARRQLNSLGSATHYEQLKNPNSLVPPSDGHNIVLGVNQDMIAGPKPEGHANLDKIRQAVLETAFTILGIVPQVVNPSGSEYKSDPATVLREWDTALQSIQQRLAPMLIEIYKAAYYEGGLNYVNAMTDQVLEEADRLEEEGGRAKADNVAPLTRRQFEAALNRGGNQDLVAALQNHRKRSLSQHIASKIEVAFSFNHTPRILLPDLRALYDMFVISEDTFVRIAGRMNNIAMDDILLDEKEREKEREKRAESKNNLMEGELALKQKYMPEKDSTQGLPSKPSSSSSSGGGGGASFGQKK